MMLPFSSRNRLSVERINRHADERGIATTRLQFERPIDRRRFFTCPSLAPLTHTPVFAELTATQQRRYNQLVGLFQNEMICFFEEEIGGYVLPALLGRARHLSPEVCLALQRFLEEEKQHSRMFRRLSRLAESGWYETADYHILRFPKPFLSLLHQISSRPALLPMVIWIMLLMEERSLMMNKRYLAIDPELIEPQFLAAYRAHAEDEIRHVHLDWHLLEGFYLRLPAPLRRLNALLLELLVVGLLLKPRRSNVRLIDLLVAEFPELRPKRPQLVQAVHGLMDNPGYRRMMYSPEATPISRALFDQLPEFARLRRRLFEESDAARVANPRQQS